jgi:DNA-binding NarL/FixJ family response regulator
MNTLALPVDPSPAVPRPDLRLWIFEDHQCFRELLADYLRTLPGITVVGTLDDEEQLHAAVAAGQVDLVLLDLHLSGAGGFQVMERLRQCAPAPAVLILSGQATLHSLAMAVRLGAVGYLQKTAPLQELVPALSAIREGRTYFGEGVPRELAACVSSNAGSPSVAELSQREVDLLARLAHGASAKELAAEWNLSCFTIYKARTQILRRINARNQRELVAYALANGLLDASLAR